MVTITLPNQNPDSLHEEVTIHLNSGKCTTKDQKDLLLKNITKQGAFLHPILDAPHHQTNTHTCHHKYHDLEGLFLSSRELYAMLLKASDPCACQLKISPFPRVQGSKDKETRRLYFSTKAQKEAEESISLSQLEALISDLSGYPFEYIDGLIIDEEFTIENLPEAIHVDSLYTTDEKVLSLLNTPMDLSRIELRYINPVMGFGLFARETIKKNDLSFIYAGEKTLRALSDPTYAFECQKDSLNMYLDARQHGNISRFINHAPKPAKNKNHLSQQPILEANLESVHHYVNGIEVVIFSACRDIKKGEQLLVDYGEKYFTSAPIHLFKSEHKSNQTPKIWLNKHSQKKLFHFRVMAKHGIKKAQQYLLLRVLTISAIIVTLLLIFNKTT